MNNELENVVTEAAVQEAAPAKESSVGAWCMLGGAFVAGVAAGIGGTIGAKKLKERIAKKKAAAVKSEVTAEVVAKEPIKKGDLKK